MTGTRDRPRLGAHLRLVWNRTGDGKNKVPCQPPGLTEWDFRFLRSIARYPLPLREMLK